MACHVVEACRAAGISRIVVVVGHEADVVRAAIGSGVEYIKQSQQLGTGHAVRSAKELFQGFSGTLAVFPADTPLIRPETIARLMDVGLDASAVLLTAVLDDPAMYGRIIRGPDRQVLGIVEAKDASPDIIAIKEICTSIYAFKADDLFPALNELSPENRQGEYYLTDVIRIFEHQGKHIEAFITDDYREALGINNRIELADAAAVLGKRVLDYHMLNGVTMVNPASTYIDVDVEIGQDTIIYPGTIIEGPGSTRIGSGCVLGPHSRITDSILGDDVVVDHSVVLGSEVDEGTVIGPFSRLRPGSRIGARVKIGDFVEIKNSVVGDEVSLAHMTYIGDSEIGPRANIGAGTITCNFDGRRKNRTSIGQDAFVGSHTTLNAPVTVGDGAFIGSGSVIDKDVPADALGIARTRQVNKEGWAKRRRKAAEE